MPSKVYEVTIFKYKPEYRAEVIGILKNSKFYPIIESNGGKVCAAMEAGLGATYEVVAIFAWDSLEQRMKTMGQGIHDPAVAAEFQRIHEMVYSKENYMTESLDGELCEIGDGPLYMSQLHVKTVPFEAATALSAMVDKMKKKFGIDSPVSILVPTIAYSKFTIFEIVPYNPKAKGMKEAFEYQRNPEAWKDVSELGKSVGGCQARILMPIP